MQLSLCQLWQHSDRPPYSAASRRQLMDRRHMQNRSHSHDLGTRRSPTHSQSVATFARRSFEDLHTYHAHARLTHLLVPAPTIRTEQHAKLARQPRRHMQHSRNGHEREPRVHQERGVGSVERRWWWLEHTFPISYARVSRHVKYLVSCT